jgi:excisionase family DNA binding protein
MIGMIKCAPGAITLGGADALADVSDSVGVMAEPESFLTIAEIADMLRVNPHTIRNWIDRQQLRAVRVGQRRSHQASRPRP